MIQSVLQARVFDVIAFRMSEGQDATVGEIMSAAESTNRAAVTQLIYCYSILGFLKPYVAPGSHGYVMAFKRTSKQEPKLPLESQGEETNNG